MKDHKMIKPIPPLLLKRIFILARNADDALKLGVGIDNLKVLQKFQIEVTPKIVLDLVEAYNEFSGLLEFAKDEEVDPGVGLMIEEPLPLPETIVKFASDHGFERLMMAVAEHFPEWDIDIKPAKA